VLEEVNFDGVKVKHS